MPDLEIPWMKENQNQKNTNWEKNNVRYLQTQKSKASNRKEKSRVKFFFAFLLIMAVLIFMISLLRSLFEENITTSILNQGVLEERIQADAYLIRQEYLVRSQKEGIFFPLALDAQRVQFNAEVAYVVEPQKKELLNRLEVLNTEILAYVTQELEKKGVVFPELRRVDDQVAKKINHLIRYLERGQIVQLESFERDIESLLESKLKSVYLSSDIEDVKFQNMIQKGKVLQEQIIQNANIVKAPISAMVSYQIRGDEKSLEVNLDAYSFEDLKEQKKSFLYRLPEKTTVKDGEPLLKLIRDDAYYIAFQISGEKENYFSKGKKIQFEVNELGRILTGEVDRVKDEKNDTVMVVLKMDEALGELVNFQSLKIDVIQKTHKGFKMPISSIDFSKENNQQARVMALKSGITKWVPVRITGMSENFVIVENINDANAGSLNLYDYYVLKPQKVEEGRFVKK